MNEKGANANKSNETHSQNKPSIVSQEVLSNNNNGNAITNTSATLMDPRVVMPPLPPLQLNSPQTNSNQQNINCNNNRNEFRAPSTPSVAMLSPSTPASVTMMSPQTPMQTSPSALMSPPIPKQLSPNQRNINNPQKQVLNTRNTNMNSTTNANNVNNNTVNCVSGLRSGYNQSSLMAQQNCQQMMSSYTRPAQMLPNPNFPQTPIAPTNPQYWNVINTNNNNNNNNNNRQIYNCNTNVYNTYNQFEQQNNWNQASGIY